MYALCVDDEALPLRALETAVLKSPDIDDAAAFDDEEEALAWARKHRFDIAFLDMQLHRMTGLELAEKLYEINPKAAVVFCTGYERYAVQALALHRDVGYLVKPFRQAQIQAEIDHIVQSRPSARAEKKLSVVCFGSFEAFVDGKPLDFGRKKSRELLAYLIDRRGATADASEVCAVLWPDKPEDEHNRDYLYHLAADLKRTLTKAGVGEAIQARGRGYAVNVDAVDCDYYRLLAGDREALRAFTGEYMYRYSWAKDTCAWLEEKFRGGGGTATHQPNPRVNGRP